MPVEGKSRSSSGTGASGSHSRMGFSVGASQKFAPDIQHARRSQTAPDVPITPAPSTPEELRKRYEHWIEVFGKIAKDVGLKPQ